MALKPLLPLADEGFWWWPENPSEQTAGTITFDSKEGGVLLLIGRTAPGRYVPKMASFPLMLGQSIDHRAISLVGPWIAEQTSTPNGFFRLKIRFGACIFGAWLESAESPCVKMIQASFVGTHVWAKDTGFGIKRHKRGYNYTIRYKIPKAQKIHLGPGLSLRFSREHSIPLDRGNDGSVNLTEKLRISIESRRPMPLAFYFKKLNSIRDFLSVGTLRFAAPSDITLKCDFRKAKSSEIRAQIKYSKLALRTYFSDPDDSKWHPFMCLFTEAAISDHLIEALQAWFKKEDAFEASLLLYNCALYSDQFHESRFLFLAQSVETLHRHTRAGTYMDDAKYKEVVLPLLLKSIPETVGRSFRHSLTNRLTYGNQHSLRKRLQEFFEDHPKVLAKFGIDAKVAASEIADARNELTHVEPKPADVPSTRRNLFHMCAVLRLIIEATLLKEIGIPEDVVSRLCVENQFYLQRISAAAKLKT